MSVKTQPDFSDLSSLDAVSLVVNTAVIAKKSGHPVMVGHTSHNDLSGIVIFIPGYRNEDGQIRPLKEVENEKA